MRRAAALLAALAACATSSPQAPQAPVDQRPPGTASTAWWNGAVVYELFVRSFQDSNGDGKGDLQGLIDRLDHLNDGDPSTTTDLGVDAIWLMPIQPSPSYHGYDVTDYDGVNPDYGAPADLDRLVAECHRRGIKVILDLVLNHSSSQHPWFLDSSSSAFSARRDWYLWRGSDPGWQQPWTTSGGSSTWHAMGGAFYYGVFWGGMPDLNWTNAAVRSEMGAVASRWLGRGADGFRLDAVRYLVENGGGSYQQDQPETHRFLKEFAAGVRAAKPDAMLVGEAWADTATIAPYYGSTGTVPGGDELPLLFDFPLADAVVSGVASGTASGIAAALDAAWRTYPRGAADAPFLTNHDQVRVATRLGADPARLRLAAAILLTLPGTPFLYYGEEIGMQNGTCAGDECKRTPMAWDATAGGGFTTGTPWWPPAPGGASVAAQTADPASLLSRYRQLIRARGASPALRRGELTAIAGPASGVLAFARSGGGETVLAAHNLGGGFASATLALPGATAEAILADPGASASASGGSWTVSLPPRGSGVWRVR
jgi:glycosidase